MPIQTLPDSHVQYYLIAFDKAGKEREDDPDGLMSVKIHEKVRREAITDIFLLSHGWKGDMPAAIDQYNRWIGAMEACGVDIARIRQKRPGFNPIYIGLHWPSLPWGDEELGGPGTSFAMAETVPKIDQLIEAYAERIAATPRAREALQVIFAAALEDSAPPTLPVEVRKAYEVLNAEADMGSEGVGAAPGADREPFDPDRAYEAEQETVNFGEGGFGGLLGPLRQLSFWKMKDRARIVGESGIRQFVADLQRATPAGRDLRIHLMGHSFGCIVVSAIVAGTNGHGALPKPVHSVVLVQGALSLWSYCSDIPESPGTPGYFRSIVEGAKVAGPIVTTQSEFDTAVGTLYPKAAGLLGQVAFDQLPKYGGVGIFGAQGPGLQIVPNEMLDVDVDYNFEPGRVYNLNSSQYICDGGGLSGAHSDIAKPQVAHLLWSAAMS